MKKMMVTAVFLGAALATHAQDLKTILDSKAKAYRQNLAKVEAEVRKQQKDLPDQYLQALTSLEQRFTKAGDLDNVLLVRKELDRFQQAKQISEEMVVQAPRARLAIATPELVKGHAAS